TQIGAVERRRPRAAGPQARVGEQRDHFVLDLGRDWVAERARVRVSLGLIRGADVDLDAVTVGVDADLAASGHEHSPRRLATHRLRLRRAVLAVLAASLGDGIVGAIQAGSGRRVHAALLQDVFGAVDAVHLDGLVLAGL